MLFETYISTLQDVEKDASMKKAYKLLMKIHSECSCVITAIDSAGQLEQEIEELNDQVRLFTQFSSISKLMNQTFL